MTSNPFLDHLADSVGDDLMADIGRLTQLHNELRQERQRLHDTLAAMADAVITTDHQSRINFFNRAAVALTDYPQESALGRSLTEIIKLHSRGSSLLIPQRFSDLTPIKSWAVPAGVTLVTRTGGERHVMGNVAPILDTDGVESGLVIVLRDANNTYGESEKRSADRIVDPVTGLLNRAEFERRLGFSLHDNRELSTAVLLYLDLDEFKIINDTCGHVAGDALLHRVAALLRRYVLEIDTLARLGGDEFGVLLRHRSVEECTRIANEICRAVQDINFQWEEKHFRTGASIGMVPLRLGRDNVMSVMRDADRACYAAKESGRSQIHVFGAQDRELVIQASQMDALSNLHDAITGDRLKLFAQPIASFTDDDAVPHVEILLRMRDADGKIALPGTFLPAAERYHQMPLVDRWVVERTFESLRELEIADRYVFAINLSGQSVGRQDFLDFVIQKLKKNGIDPQHICFEITEGAAIANVDRAHNFLSVLRELGCHFALDDFGVGMSSLSYLRRLPIDYLKIDGSFIREIGSDPLNEAMVRAIHQVAMAADVKTVAESIETFADLQMIESIGIDLVQGYLVAHPMPLEELRDFQYGDIHKRLNGRGSQNFTI